MIDRISIFLDLFCGLTSFTAENTSRALKNMYSIAFGWNILYILIKPKTYRWIFNSSFLTIWPTDKMTFSQLLNFLEFLTLFIIYFILNISLIWNWTNLFSPQISLLSPYTMYIIDLPILHLLSTLSCNCYYRINENVLSNYGFKFAIACWTFYCKRYVNFQLNILKISFYHLSITLPNSEAKAQ